jgi:nucleotide-binding universal stress UspA family protein
MYDRILVPTDGGEQALRAAEHGRYLAGVFDATLDVLHVLDDRGVAGTPGKGEATDDTPTDLEASGRRAIADARERGPSDRPVRTALRRGTPAEEVLSYVDEFDVDLVVMGTHGRTGVDRFVTGSVTEQVIRHAPVPVVTVRVTDRSDVADGYGDVLVPTDGSAAARAAAEHGLTVADGTGASVHVLTVVEAGDAADETGNASPAEAATDPDAGGEDATAAVATRAAAAGLDTTTEVREGVPAEAVLSYVDEHGVDLVVMGTTGRTGPGRYLLGSTTERVVRHAPVAVLAVNARDADPAGSGRERRDAGSAE